MLAWLDVTTPEVAWARFAHREGPTWLSDDQLWVVHSPAQVDAVASDTERFSNAVPGDRNLAFDFLLTVDPPRHGVDRSAFLRRFAPRLHATNTVAPKLAEECAAPIVPSGPVELVDAFCRPLAAAVGQKVIGRLDPVELSEHAPPVERRAFL